MARHPSWSSGWYTSLHPLPGTRTRRGGVVPTGLLAGQTSLEHPVWAGRGEDGGGGE